MTQKILDYLRTNSRSDMMAALVVTAIAVPESLAFAAIVGLPLQTGLYTALFAPIVFAVFASTKRLIVGADSATAALVAAGAGVLAGSYSHSDAIILLGIATGIILALLSIFRFGFLADLISRPVLIGFFAGIGIQLIVHKLPEMLRVETSGTVLHQLQDLPFQLPNTHLLSLLLALIVIVFSLFLPKKYPRILIGLVIATSLSVIIDAEKYGVSLVGAIPSGLPGLSLPPLTLDAFFLLVPTALSIALVILAQSSAVIRSQAADHDEKVNINKDLLALGAANITSALTQGFALNGSPPRSIAAEHSGGKTQMVNVFMSILIGAILLFGTGLFTYIPLPALAAVIFVVGLHLIRIPELRQIGSTHPNEFAIAIIAMLGVALFGVRQGVIIAIVISLMERLRRQYHPRDEVLLRDDTLSEWGQERIDPHHRHTSRPRGLLVYAYDGPLFFDNVEYFIERVSSAIKSAKEPVDTVIIDAGAIDAIDYTAVRGIKRLHDQLHADEIRLGFAHVSPALHKQFSEFGIRELIGETMIFSTLNSAIINNPNSRRTTIEMVKRLDVPKNSYVVIGGGVMETLGLREAHDVDMVVSESLYKKYRDKKQWKEFVHDDGKRVLSHNGYHMMQTWMGRDLARLRKDAFIKDDVVFMSVAQLIACKRRLGRNKDKSDLALLEKYKQTQT